MPVVKRIIKIIDKCNSFNYWVLGIGMIASGLLVFLDVILRYIFGIVTTFGYDLALWLTALVGLIGGGYITKIREHTAVDVLHQRFPKKAKLIVNLICYVMILFLAVVMVYYGIDRVAFYYSRGSVAMTGFNIYLWIKWIIVPYSGLFLGLQGIAEFIKDLYELVTGKSLTPTTAGNDDSSAERSAS